MTFDKRERQDDGPDEYVCDNCTTIHPFEDLNDIEDLDERVEAGGMVPAGECPDCGCLAYPVPKAPSV